jgi:hypothetical protein
MLDASALPAAGDIKVDPLAATDPDVGTNPSDAAAAALSEFLLPSSAIDQNMGS